MYWNWIFFLLPMIAYSQKVTYEVSSGKINFISSALLERIEATSENLKGIIDPINGTYGFSVDITSFHGFNSPLQREHFNENYLESHRFPKATFTGKIIEKLDFSQKGTYHVRCKGKFLVHGIEQERIIQSVVTIDESGVNIASNFSVLLEDYQITVPRIVNHKIAKEIEVRVEARLSIHAL